MDDATADFALALTDVSSTRWSKARRLMRSVATLGLMRGGSSDDLDAALGTLSGLLESAGFQVLEISGPGGGSDDVIALIRGTDAQLHKEFYKEQLNAWVQSSTRGDFAPNEVPPEGFFTPARRVALLHTPLLELLPRVRAKLRSDLLSVAGVHPIQNRRFCASLLSHLCRKPLLQAQLLHGLRNEFGEKVAFLFAFRTHQQRWLALPAALGVLLWCSRLVSQQLPALLTPLFGLAVPVWASLLLEGWQHRQRELASLWGVDELREAEVVRPEYRGERVLSSFVSAGGAADGVCRGWQRLMKRFVAIPVLGAQLLVLTAIIIALYVAWIAIYESDHHRAVKTMLVVLVSAAWGVLVEALNWQFFHRLASLLNHFENHRTTAEFETKLVRKLTAFLLVDGFLWYFLLAFLQIPFGGQIRSMLGLHEHGFKEHFWKHALVTSIATLLVGTVPLSALWSVAPLLMRHARTTSTGGLATPSGRHLRQSPPTTPTSPTGRAVGSGSRGAYAQVDDAADAVDSAASGGGGGGGGGGDDAGDGAPGSAGTDAEMGNLHGALREALLIRQRRASLPPAPLLTGVSAGLTRVLSDDNSSSSDDDELCGGSNLWPRSVRLTSLLARRLPWPRHLHQRARRSHRSLMVAGRRHATRLAYIDGVADEGRRPVYDPMLDHARATLEFGYVVMFTVVWPLTPLCCLIISALEQRAAALRLTVACQRPASGLRCEGLGTGNAWFGVLTLLSWVSVPINCGMIALATQQLEDARGAFYDETGREGCAAALAAPVVGNGGGGVVVGGEGACAPPLTPFAKLLVAVVAEHVLLAMKLAIAVVVDGGSREPASQASAAVEEQRRKYLLGFHGLADANADGSGPPKPGYLPPGGLGSSALLGSGGGAGVDREPRLTSIFPTSGSCEAGAAVSLRGERLGGAVNRGELTLLLTPPRPGKPMTVPATFVSERKVTCVLPPSVAPGVSTVELLLPDGKGGCTKSGGAAGGTMAGGTKGLGSPGAGAAADGGGGAVAAGADAMDSAPATPVSPSSAGGVQRDWSVTFRYYSSYAVSRLRPSSGPLSGGTAVRVFGSGFVNTGELAVCVRLHGVERRVPATFISDSEVRFLAPSFTEHGDAKVGLSLNGQEYEPRAELVFAYERQSFCSVQ